VDLASHDFAADHALALCTGMPASLRSVHAEGDYQIMTPTKKDHGRRW